MVRREAPDGVVVHLQYDDRGRLLTVRSEDRELLGNTYNSAGQLVETRTPHRTVELEYDACGRVIAEIQDGSPVTTQYRSGGRIIRQEVRDSAAGPRIYGLDERNRVTQLSFGNIREQYEYDSSDQLSRRLMGAAEERFAYDIAGRLTVHTLAAPAALSETYSYNLADQLITLDAASGVTRYRYDPGLRLIESVAGTDTSKQYSYDTCGNLIARSDLGALTYEPGNRLARAGGVDYRRDACGNVSETAGNIRTSRFEWGPAGELLSSAAPDGTVTSYGYDGFGRRAFKETDGIRTEFFWAGDFLVCERTGDHVTEYVHAAGSPIAQVRDGEAQHVVRSPRFTPEALVDVSGNVTWRGDCDDWGAADGPAATPFRLPGQYADRETGWHYNRFRYFDPAAGQFVSPDPLGFVASPNEFRYAPNPISWFDFLGLTCGNVGCPNYCVYVLKYQGRVVYIGITMEAPQARCNQHKQTKIFDHMTVIANCTVGNAAQNRVAARDIEGSALYNVYAGSHAAGGQATNPAIQANGLMNAQRLPANPGYYHSYDPNALKPGRNYLPPGTTRAYLDHNGTCYH